MATRRSTPRASSATPISVNSPTRRSARTGNAVIPEEAVRRRTTRGTSQQPSVSLAEGGGDVNNPRLPEVQIQQSYAYGSSKTPVLPTQLVARSKMNLREMADTIDVGVQQAQRQLQDHIEETRANLQQDSRTERARRRESRERSREASVASDEGNRNTKRRVEAWANSLDDSQLDEIQEEANEGEEEAQEEIEVAARNVPDDASHPDTEPSSFPSGIGDHSYNYERGLRKPNIVIRQRKDPFLRKAWLATKGHAQHTQQVASHFLASSWDWLQRLMHACGEAINDLPNSPLVFILTNLIFALALVGGASLLFCYTYSNYVCDPYSSSPVGMTLQKYCGTCSRSPGTILNFTAGGGDQVSKLATAISSMNAQIRALESRLSDRVDARYSAMDKDLEALRRQHLELSNGFSGLTIGRSSLFGDVASPIMAKVNYFAPNNGAVVQPRLTSPTLQTLLPLAQRVMLRAFGLALYQSRPPDTALAPWQDVGDCWCASADAASQDLMRLGVKVTEMIFPTELVVENYPNAGSLSPGTTPRRIEVWADFEHLDSREWESLGIRQLQGDSPIGPTYALIGRMEYDASPEAAHVQAFKLEVNQFQYLYAAEVFVVRVVSNYGSDHTCLYRVRMHGVSAAEHGWTSP